MLDFLLDDTNTRADLWGDAAYRSKDREQELAAQGYRSHIHTKGQVNRPLNERQKVANRRRSKIRARVEHVFASQATMGGQRVRTIGLARARVKIALNNMLYNLKRFAYLQGATA